MGICTLVISKKMMFSVSMDECAFYECLCLVAARMEQEEMVVFFLDGNLDVSGGFSGDVVCFNGLQADLRTFFPADPSLFQQQIPSGFVHGT